MVVPNGVVGVQSYIGWVYSDDTIAVVGEIRNNTSSRRKAIDIKVTYFASTDPGSPVLGSHTERVLLDGVARGGVGPFVVYDGLAHPDVGAFQIEVVSPGGTGSSTPAGGGLNIETTPSYVSDGIRYYPGTIVNPNTFAVDNLRVGLAAYDAAGNVGEVMCDTDNCSRQLGPIAAGGSAGFLIGIADDFGPDFTMASVKLLADGYQSGSTTVYVTSWANYFDDVYDSQFAGDIAWLAQEGITTGCTPGKFCPTKNVRRDEMASFLTRAIPLSGTAPDAFTDDDGNIHEPNINLVANAGITTGCAPGEYCPASTVKRDQMASFLARSLGLSGTAPDAFTDDEGNIHEININLVAEAGVTTGCSATKFCPTSLVTRGQMAAFLRRAFD